MKIMILGSGGREDAMAWRISEDIGKDNVYVLPGNGGSARFAHKVDGSVNDFDAIANAIISNKIDILLIGPEDPLVKGLRDYLETEVQFKNLQIIGPSAKGAMLEGSKDFAKRFMQKNNIPTAKYKSFTKENSILAFDFLKTLKPPYVIKADGLAAGKGVAILSSIDEAKEHIENIFSNNIFGDAGNSILIEEFLDGIELSVFALTDGKNYVLLPEAKDYKRIGDGDVGPNTGGMGAVSPVFFADEEFMNKVKTKIVEPTIKGLQKENIDYKGFIFFGLINVANEPFVIEYNVRMGDPETQSVMPRIGGSFVDILAAVNQNRLDKVDVEIKEEVSLAVIVASEGYPGSYKKNIPMEIFEDDNAILFHAGTIFENGKYLTSGGRVVASVGIDSNIETARTKAYNGVKNISFQGKTFRTDIGLDLEKYEPIR